MASGVEFDEDKFGSTSRAYTAQRNESKFASWLIKHGLAKSAGSAQVVMVAVIIVNLVVAYIIIKKFL